MNQLIQPAANYEHTRQLYTPKEFFVHQPEKVEFRKAFGETTLVLDDQWEMRLDRRSQVVGQLGLGVDPELLKPHFANGRYFIVDDIIVDHRESSTLGFVHNDAAIRKLADTIGFVSVNNRLSAGNVTHQLEYEAFAEEGGQFDVEIGFEWSPFSIDIQSDISILRMVCANLMTARSPIMNHTIPMLNTWEENLAISNQVISHSFHKLVGPRLKALVDERVSMHDVVMMQAFVSDLRGSNDIDFVQQEALDSILEKIQPLFTPEVSHVRRNLLKFIQAPITGYDAMNIATECATHYVGSDRKSTRAIGFANNLIFDNIRQRNIRTDLDKLVVDTQTFGDVNQAFYGITSH